MDLKQLRALLAISETGSITRAAELLHIVQPAVSRQLRLLEDEIGTALFERGSRGMELTDAGQLMVTHARRALAELDRAKTAIVPDKGVVSGSVNIGLLPSTAELLAAPVVRQLQRKYPRLEVSLSVAYGGFLRQRLEDGEIDIALLYEPGPTNLLDVRPLVDEPLHLVASVKAGLDMNRPVSLQDLAKFPLVLPGQKHGIRTLLDTVCSRSGIELIIAAETDAMFLQKSLAANEIGYTVLPGVAIADDLKQGRLTASPISADGLTRRIILASSITRRTSTAVRCTGNELYAVIHSFIENGTWPGATWLGSSGHPASS